jgi:hypothetical protein
MRCLDTHCLVIAALYLLVFSVIGINAYADEVENLIRNGDFEEGTIEWALRQSEGAVATMREEKGEAIKGRSCVFIDIDNVAGTDAWHLSLYQEGHELGKNQTYTLSFWAKAEEPRQVAYYVEQAIDPWDEYGRESVQVNEEWQEYWTTFTASISGAVWPRIALGESDVSIWVDNVRFYEGEYVEEEDLETQNAVGPASKLLMTWGRIKGSD